MTVTVPLWFTWLHTQSTRSTKFDLIHIIWWRHIVYAILFKVTLFHLTCRYYSLPKTWSWTIFFISMILQCIFDGIIDECTKFLFWHSAGSLHIKLYHLNCKYWFCNIFNYVEINNVYGYACYRCHAFERNDYYQQTYILY